MKAFHRRLRAKIIKKIEPIFKNYIFKLWLPGDQVAKFEGSLRNPFLRLVKFDELGPKISIRAVLL